MRRPPEPAAVAFTMLVYVALLWAALGGWR
jgi:hypothetical protein